MTQTFQELKIKEEYFDLMPRPTKEERQMLKESIQIHGQREPIIVNEDGVILDGHTRFEICQELGRKPEYVIKDMGDRAHERVYVIDANLARRQLGLFQKFELVYSLYSKEKTQRNKRVGGIRIKEKKDNAKTFGRQVGMSRDYFLRCQYLLHNADRDTLAMLRANTISIQVAYQRLRKNGRGVGRESPKLKNSSVVECPSCNHHFPRKQLRVVTY